MPIGKEIVSKVAGAINSVTGDKKRMLHRQVRSSAIERIGWNPLTQELSILFNKNGRYPEYIFGGVPEELAFAFMTAPSHGKFYHRYIRNTPGFIVSKPLGSFRLGALGRRVTNIFRLT